MKPEEVREIVRITIEELISASIIKDDNYTYINEVVSSRLNNLFVQRKPDKTLTSVLYSLSDDPYLDVIYLQYRDGKTLEYIAEVMDKDVRTITRNKKRLITTIYNKLN